MPQSPIIPIEDVARPPWPGLIAPTNLAFSPDDQWITYLYSPEHNLVNQLFAFDPQTGARVPLMAPGELGTSEENLSHEEVLLRERQRQINLGVTQYAWAEHANRLVIPLAGDLYVKDSLDAALRKLVGCQGPTLQAQQISPDGDWVTYIQDAELYRVPFDGGQPLQLTQGARGTGKTHGLAEFIAQEEMDRRHGYWWSPDSRWIAFEEVDETHIPVYRIVHQGKEFGGGPVQEDHAYPFAGQANAYVRLGVISVEGGEPVWMDLGPEQDIYLCRVNWFPDGSLWVQIENREQTRLDLLRFDPSNGRSQLVLTETSPVWINLHHMLRPLRDGSFIWASEHTGFRHLYYYNSQGSLVCPITQGEWMVDALSGVDEEKGLVYFTATRETPLESHLYVALISGGEPVRLTNEPGMHTVQVDHVLRSFIDSWSDRSQPSQLVLRSLKDGSTLKTIFAEPDPRLESLRLSPPEIVTFKNRQGDCLYGAIFKPEQGQPPFPTIVSVYGGPHAQMVTNNWILTASMRAQYLRSLGFLVFTLDNRGSARRGLEFEGAIKHDLGHLEVEDQVDGVRWLIEQGLADPERVGIYGWSYGGYMAAMCLARSPETFKAAVAGAPVSALDGYDTHYTERYMGTPQSNPDGYASSSVLAHVDNLRGRLLLVHGLIDENVHFRHTARLINALIKSRKRYELLLFPDERHLPRKLEDRIFMEENIRDFFLEALGR